MSPKIKAVIFDLGNVLIDFDHMRSAGCIAKFTQPLRTGAGFTQGYSPQEIYSLFFDSELTQGFEEGKISPQDFFLQVKAKLNLNLGFKEFMPIWNEIFFLTEKNRAVYNLAKSLKNNYKTALVSNINILHYEYVLKTFPIFDAFQHIILSCSVGLRKPEPLIYQQALSALEVSAEEAFYTDDRQELVTGAKKLGIRGFAFTNIEELNKDLSSCGIALPSNTAILPPEK